MAKLNQLLRAFDHEELELLNTIMEHEYQSAIEEGTTLTQEFHDLKETIHRASKYANGMLKHESNA